MTGEGRSLRQAAAHHAHDFDLVAFAQRHGCIGRAFQDLAVVFDRHGTRVDAELLEIGEQRCRPLELDALAVDLERDHSNAPMAAYPAAPASRHSSIRSSRTPPIASTGM